MQNWGENAPVSAFLHSAQSIFTFFTKHFCKLKHHHLRIVNMAFAKRNQGIYEA